MTFSSPIEPDEQSFCIDPRVVFGSGGGVDDPSYVDHNQVVQDTIDLDHDENSNAGAQRNGHDCDLVEKNTSAPDAAHETAPGMPSTSTPSPSNLDPKAPDFVPNGPFDPDAFVRNEVEPTLEQLRPVKSAPTPKIKVSKPYDPSDAHRRKSSGAGRKSGPQSRQSSPGQSRSRSASVSHSRSQSKSRQSPALREAIAAELGISVGSGSNDWLAHGAYNVGDRFVRPVEVNHAQLQPYSYGPTSSPGSQSQVWRCDHEGCPDSSKVWDTKSECDHHKRKHMSKELRPHKCEHCPEAFLYPKDLERHTKAVHDKAKILCTFCHKPFSRQDNLKRHVQTLHKYSQSSASSPAPSSVTSFAQSPVLESGPSTPLTWSPIESKSAPASYSSKAPQHGRHDSANDPGAVDCYSPAASP